MSHFQADGHDIISARKVLLLGTSSPPCPLSGLRLWPCWGDSLSEPPTFRCRVIPLPPGE